MLSLSNSVNLVVADRVKLRHRGGFVYDSLIWIILIVGTDQSGGTDADIVE